MNKHFLATTFVGTILTFTTQLFSQNVLPTSGNVGIGITSPSTALDVVGTTKLRTVVIKDSLTIEKN